MAIEVNLSTNRLTWRCRWRCFLMPFGWYRRGCYDRKAHLVAWTWALLGRPLKTWSKRTND